MCVGSEGKVIDRSRDDAVLAGDRVLCCDEFRLGCIFSSPLRFQGAGDSRLRFSRRRGLR